jgi:hypothetical protein
VPAITCWQPWASLIARGAKPFETRSRPPPRRLVGARIAIHAARRPVEPLAAAAAVLGGRDLPRGAVVCTAILIGAYRLGEGGLVTDAVRGSPPLLFVPPDPFGDYAPGRWAWHLVEVAALDPPAPARGHQGWWRWAR